MVILEQTSERLRIGYDGRPWRRWFWFALAFATLVFFAAIQHTVEGRVGVILICGLPTAYLGLVRVSEEWQFDRVSGNLTIVRRALLLPLERLLRYPLTDIARISWEDTGDQDTDSYDFCLHMRSGETVKLSSTYDLCADAPSIGEAIATFLGVPAEARKNFISRLLNWFQDENYIPRRRGRFQTCPLRRGFPPGIIAERRSPAPALPRRASKAGRSTARC